MRAFQVSRSILWAITAAAAVSSLAAGSVLNAQTQSLVAPRITQAVNESATVTLHGTVSPLATAQNDVGQAAPDTRLERIQLALQRSPQQESDLKQLIGDMNTPGSANYHKWLTPAQFGQQFGPSDQDVQAIEAWVQSHGFQVGTLEPGKGVLEISGTVGQLQDTFHTSIHQYNIAGQLHYANATAPQIPAALAPVLQGFVSLNNFPVHRMSQFLGKASFDPQTGQTTPQWTSPSSSPLGYDLVLSPKDFYAQYDLNPLYTAGTNGSGQTIAIVNDANINISFVNNFRTLFGLPANPPQVIIDGNDPGIDGINNVSGPNGDSIEAYLDVEWSGAVAPNATIDLVIGADTALAQGLILAAQRVIYSDLAPVLSLSFGACEQSLGSGNQFLSSLWQQAAAEGITILVASGDNGSAGCDSANSPSATGGTTVSGYASTPYDVAVGGTDFYYSNYKQGSAAIASQLGTYWNLTPSTTPNESLTTPPIPEQPWNDSSLGSNILQAITPTIAGGSGGPSTCGVPTTDPNTGAVVTCAPYPKPAWQVATNVPADKARDIPDVSLFAADGVNASFYPICAGDGDCQSGLSPIQISGVGGTSASAPSMAGIMALINQKYGPQGQADYVLYPMAKQFPAAFHDVIAGTNAVPCTVSPQVTTCGSNGQLIGYAATAGYDPASGLGSVDANQLVTNWSSVKFTATTTTLKPGSTSFAHGTAVTITGGVTGQGGTPTGSIALMTDNTAIYQQSPASFALTNGSISGSTSTNYLPGGTYNVWGQYSGDGTFGASTSSKTQVTVTPEASSLIFQVVTPSATTAGQYQTVGQSVPYGTQIILDGQVVPSSYYNNCYKTQSTSTQCQNTTFGGATGTVVFSDNGKAINTAVINAEGDAEYTGPYAMGPHSITAAYPGDASYNASSASAIPFTVIQGSPIVNVTANQNPIATGQTLVLTAVVDSGGNGTAPTGSVTFSNGTTTLGSATLVAGVDPSTGFISGIGAITVPNVPSGNKTITAIYSGDTNYAKASGSLALAVTATTGGLPSTTTGSASATTTSPTAGITLSATVAGQAGHPAPTGTVNFLVSGQPFFTLNLKQGSGTTSTASAAVNSAILYQGANVITLQYSGDTVYQPSSFSLPNPITNPLSDFSMVAQTPVITVASGKSATQTVNFTSLNGFNSAVALTCTAPSSVTCSLNPASVTVNGTTTSTLTINAVSSATASLRQTGPGWLLASGGATLACVFMLGLPGRRRRWQSLLGLVIIAVLTAGIGIGCGGGSSSNGGGSSSTPGGGGNSGNNGNTATGSYTVVVNGTQGAIAHNVAVTVKVQ